MLRLASQKIGLWLRDHPRLGGWALRLCPDIPIAITVPSIGPFRIRLRRHRSFWLRDPLTHDRFQLGALKCFVQPGSTVYDVGANIGL